jgi:hypothetical protein
MKKNDKSKEPQEIIVARKVATEALKNLMKNLENVKTALMRKQGSQKIDGGFIYSIIFMRYLSEYVNSEELMNKINTDFSNSGLSVVENKDDNKG